MNKTITVALAACLLASCGTSPSTQAAAEDMTETPTFEHMAIRILMWTAAYRAF